MSVVWKQPYNNLGKLHTRQKQYTTQEVANDKVDKLAGRAWKEEFDGVVSHYCHSTLLQTMLPDESISGNLARKILEEITTFRGKQQMRRTLQLTKERMAMIDEEITASNARKIGKSSRARAQFSNSTPIIGTWRREQTSSMIEYQ